MGIQFSAINPEITRVAFDGSARPVDLLGDSEEWGLFGLGNMRAGKVFSLLGIEMGYCGTASIAEFRRGIMRARASFATRAPQLATPEERHAGGHAGVRITQEGNVSRIERMGAPFVSFAITEEYLAMRIYDIEAYVSAAQAAGATAITWG